MQRVLAPVEKAELVVIEHGGMYHGGAPLELGEDRPTEQEIMRQIVASETDAFGQYPNAEKYMETFLHGGFLAALVSGIESGDVKVQAKGGLMIGGMGSLALATYEKALPPGVGHHEGYFTDPRFRGKQLQRRLIEAIEQSANLPNAAPRADEVREFTVAVQPTGDLASIRNFMRTGFVGVAFDENYLAPPLDAEGFEPHCMIGLKVHHSRTGVMAEGRTWVDYNPRECQDKTQLFTAIHERLADGMVCTWADRLENANERDIDGSVRLSFVPVSSLHEEQRAIVRRVQPQILERM